MTAYRTSRYQFDLRADGFIVVTAIGQGIPIDVFPLGDQGTLSSVADAWVREWGVE